MLLVLEDNPRSHSNHLPLMSFLGYFRGKVLSDVDNNQPSNSAFGSHVHLFNTH